MYASHTLIAYPVTARFGITKSPAVLISVVGTIVAVIGALLSLAIALNVQRTGQFSILAIALLLAKLIIYCGAVLSIYPLLTRSFLRRYNDRVTQFVYVLALVFLAAYVAQAIGLEAVLGAFLAGLVLNRFVPNTSPLMSRIEFVGNALFIPYFLIGVGMMIDVRVIAQKDTLIMAANMLAVALSAKWIAAWLTQKFYRMTPDDRGVMFRTLHRPHRRGARRGNHWLQLRSDEHCHAQRHGAHDPAHLRARADDHIALGRRHQAPHARTQRQHRRGPPTPQSRTLWCLYPLLSPHSNLWNWPSRSTPEDRPTTSTPSTSATTTPP